MLQSGWCFQHQANILQLLPPSSLSPATVWFQSLCAMMLGDRSDGVSGERACVELVPFHRGHHQICYPTSPHTGSKTSL